MAAIAVPEAQSQRLQIELIEIDLLKPDADNARVHTPKQLRQLARSITKFNFNQPILVDAENKVIARPCSVRSVEAAAPYNGAVHPAR